jgi:hypothetical protein
MKTILVLNRSKKQGKRFNVKIFEDGLFKRSIDFGSSEHENYTMHKDNKRKENYINRHSRNEDWNTINAGSLARFLLWNKKTLGDSILDFQKRFDVKILNKSYNF